MYIIFKNAKIALLALHPKPLEKIKLIKLISINFGSSHCYETNIVHKCEGTGSFIF